MKPRNLCEAHVHLAMLGRALTMLDVSAVRSAAELEASLRAEHARLAPGKWLLASGLRIEAWDVPLWPTRVELESWAPGRAVIVRGFDYHSLVASEAAFAAAHVKDSEPDPPAGVFCRDAMGKLTGVCLEAAARRVWDAAPDHDREERKADVLAAAAHLKRFGFTELHELLSPPWLGELLAELIDAGLFDMRVKLFPLLEDLDEVAATAPAWERDTLKLGGGKVFADGTLNARTAWMLEPYADGMAAHRCGVPNVTQRHLRDAVAACEELGLPLATHAIGDRAVREVLDAIEAVGSGRVRHRVEHAEIIDEADVPRFARLGAIASVQPCHLLYDIEVLRRALPQRLERVLPLRELIDAGCTPGELLLFGSDAPIVGADPVDSVQAAVFRRRKGMAVGDGIGIEQAISDGEAWRAFRAVFE